LFFALGSASKPMVVVLPALLLLMDWWPLGRMGAKAAAFDRKVAFERVVEKAPWLAIAAALAAVTIAAQAEGGALRAQEIFPLGARLANALASYVVYGAQLFWPSGLVPFYPFPPAIDWLRTFTGAAILVSVGLLAWRFRARAPYVLFGTVWYVVALLPVAGILQAGGQAHADRYMYLALVGPSVAMVWALAGLATEHLRFGVAAAIAAVAALAVASHNQVAHWKSSYDLWRHAVVAGPPSYRAEAALGMSLAERGERDEAIAHLRRAVQLAPAFADGQRNLGLLLVQADRVEEALPYLADAATLLPDSAEARRQYGVALARARRLAEAETQLRAAWAQDGADPVTHNDLGTVLALEGQLDQAAASFGRAIALAPETSSFRLNRARAYLALGRLDEARSDVERVLASAPADREARALLDSLRRQ
jgi:Flp pilus assembly protein TadD